MKIVIWPDGFWCENWHRERRQVEQGRSDDCEVVEVPSDVEDVDAFVEARLKQQGSSHVKS